MLTQAAINAAKPRHKAYKLTDARQLYLYITPQGAMSWRLNYRFLGLEKTLTLGLYRAPGAAQGAAPDVTLAQARERAQAARVLIANGTDPGAEKKQEKAAAIALQVRGATVGSVGAVCFKAPELPPQEQPAADDKPHKPKWLEERRRLEMHIYPALKDRPIAEVTSKELAAEIKKLLEVRKREQARRVLMACGKLWDRAIEDGHCEDNIVPSAKRLLKNSLKKTAEEEERHFPSIQDPRRFGELLRAIDGYGERGQRIDPSTAYAWKLQPLVFLRDSELRWSRWSFINWQTAEWRIPKKIMKRPAPHIIPLSRQAIQYLRELYERNGYQEFLFPSLRKRRPLSNSTLSAALRIMGFPTGEMCCHGARSFFSTQVNEHGWPDKAIEIQLTHKPEGKNKTKGAYDYAKHLPTRRVMMQWWADYLDSLRLQQPKPVIPYAAIKKAIAEESFMHDPDLQDSDLAQAA